MKKMTHLPHFYFTTYHSIAFTLLIIFPHTRITDIIVPHNDTVNYMLSFQQENTVYEI